MTLLVTNMRRLINTSLLSSIQLPVAHLRCCTPLLFRTLCLHFLRFPTTPMTGQSLKDSIQQMYDLGALQERLRDKRETNELVESIYENLTSSSFQGEPSSARSDNGYDANSLLPSGVSGLYMSDPGSSRSRLSQYSCPSLSVQIGPNPSVPLNSKIPSMLFKGYDHATWYVSNAKQTARFFVENLGFEYHAYKGLETGSKLIAAHVVKNGDVIFEFVSALHSLSEDAFENEYLQEIHEFIRRHGDGVRDVSFQVEDVDVVFECAVHAGAKSVCPPSTLKDNFGTVRVATIEVFDDVHHTLIQKDRSSYRGPYLPGYLVHPRAAYEKAADFYTRPPVSFRKIDHCVQNEDWNKLEEACDVYKKIFGFHEFWSVDENDVSTEYSALRSIVMASANEEVKMPMNEPAKGLCKSQIEEFLEFYNGPGVQHIALLTDNICETIKHMRMRGAEFIAVPKLYYENLLPNLLKTGVKIEEDLNQLKQLGILIDFDEKGYLLQIFTKPLTDRPTFFLEIIQRHNHNGFGKGNFKALFETIEQEQRKRGTLTRSTRIPKALA